MRQMREKILHNPLKMDQIREKISAALHQPQHQPQQRGVDDRGSESPLGDAKRKRKRDRDEEKREKKARKAARKEEKRRKKQQKELASKPSSRRDADSDDGNSRCSLQPPWPLLVLLLSLLSFIKHLYRCGSSYSPNFVSFVLHCGVVG